MIDISEVEVTGFKPAIRGCRNPMNSWEKSDSIFYDQWSGEYHDICGNSGPYDSDRVSVDYELGKEDLTLMTKLAKAGTEHAKYRRMIIVTCDITAPLYWWKEYDTYKVGTVANSCSTMHKIAAKEFTPDDFSYEHLLILEDLGEDPFVMNPIGVKDGVCGIVYGYGDNVYSPTGVLGMTIKMLNRARDLYLETKDKKYWWQMIQLLPSSYNQKRTVQLSYENLAAIYRQRKDHKLDEWHTFCDWIKSLPYAKEVITLDD